MQPAAYPQKTCREPIFGSSGIGYTCELADLHTGPCATFSDSGSVTRRDAWESGNPDLVGQSSLVADIIIPGPGDRKS